MSPVPHPYRLKDGTVRWAVRFRLAPGTNPVKESFTTQDEAAKFCRLIAAVGPIAARQARAASDTAGRETPSLAAWFDHHLAQLAASRTPGTIADYRRMAARTWLPTLGPLPVDAVTREAVTAWVSAQRGTETAQSAAARATARAAGQPLPPPRTYAPKSIANAQRLLSTVLQAAVDAGVIARNPARAVPLPSDHHREGMVFLTAAEFARLYDVLPAYWRPLVLTLYATGIRWGEATALTVADLDLASATPTARITKAWKKGAAGVYLGAPKTRRGVRTVTLPAPVAAELATHTAGRAPADLVFPAPQGGRVRAANFRDRVWVPTVAAADLGKRVRVHDLRHSHASALIAAGVPLTVIQRRLGHESIKTTSDTYGHLAPEAYAGAAEAAAATLLLGS